MHLHPVPDWLTQKAWDNLAPKERALQTMAYLADVVKVREVGGNNKGEAVGQILAAVGLPVGYAWCAAAVSFARKAAGLPLPLRAAAVKSWPGFLPATTKPERGDICYWLNPDGTGHMGLVIKVALGMCLSLEGNTGPGEAGNQRDGDGLYRRVRLAKTWKYLRADAKN